MTDDEILDEFCVAEALLEGHFILSPPEGQFGLRRGFRLEPGSRQSA